MKIKKRIYKSADLGKMGKKKYNKLINAISDSRFDLIGIKYKYFVRCYFEGEMRDIVIRWL